MPSKPKKVPKPDPNELVKVTIWLPRKVLAKCDRKVPKVKSRSQFISTLISNL